MATNSVRSFLADQCSQDPEGVVAKPELYRAYARWCAQRDQHCAHRTTFAEAVYRLAPHVTSGRSRVSGKLVGFFLGVRLLPTDEPPTEVG